MYRIAIQSSTAFFKNDMTITSVQQSYECPPLSTIYGLISAAVGEKVQPIPVGYIFNYEYKTEDYELITRPLKKSEHKNAYYELINSGRIFDRHDVLQGCFGAIPITREILFKCTLYLYIEDEVIATSFNSPYYTMLMGRSEDLAFVKEVKDIQLKHNQTDIILGKTIIPFNPSEGEVFGQICSMPVYISDDIPRKVLKNGIYMIINRPGLEVSNSSYRFLFDEELERGVYIHKFG